MAKGKQPTPEEREREEQRKGWLIFFRDLAKEADEFPAGFIRQYGRTIFDTGEGRETTEGEG